ncbi:head maturation protease, ClpP-related [Collinsella aerofaciens]|uniref:head maturation protease, ClpP-related n=1 Tax=Collinsella aerofaciens TaxID=74426 RepID=UPI001D105E06|nr:head maturation protease, ClpP-related [Collinsella aerofaciens]MCC2803198.1 Clp protease ClpP [Collinsella aerofaciens]
MFRIKNEAEKATVYLYGTIGSDFWSSEESNTAKNFAKELDGLKGKPVDIRIDSLGGDVYEGFAIASAIQRYKGETTAHIDGIAASAASYIAMMADKVVMSSFAQLMIHDAWTYAQGNAQELADVKKAMDEETWYTADEALELGLVDEKVATEKRVADALDRTLMGRFKHAPADAIEKSHAVDTVARSEEGFVLLGNHVYRKE